MGKRGPQPDPNAKQPVSIRVEPDTKELMEKHGDAEYWRNILGVMAVTKKEHDQGIIDPAYFALIAGERIAQVTLKLSFSDEVKISERVQVELTNDDDKP